MDKFWAVLSSFDFWLPFFILAALWTLLKGGFRARAMLVCLLLSVAIMEGLVVNPLKSAFGRPRPTGVLSEARSVGLASVTPRVLAIAQPLRIKAAQPSSPPKPGKSFPSGHTANMFCLATILTAFYGRRGALFFLPAALVAVSRVSTGSHWPSDVIFTAMLSILLTMILLRIFGWLWEKFSPRIVPSLASLHPKLIEPA